MRALPVVVLLSVAAGTALAYSDVAIAETVTAAAIQVRGSSSEPAALLLSGGLLIWLAGAVRRLTP